MNIGIIQGRLSTPKEGFQECPNDWQKEFELAKKINLNHIEWVITAEKYYENPILDLNTKKPEHKISSVCADFFVSNIFQNQRSLSLYLTNLCNAVEKTKIKYITIPLLEQSSVISEYERHRFIEFITEIKDRHKNLLFSFEAELDLDPLIEILSISDRFFVTYDTGNMTSFGANHSEYISEISKKITNVHLKDRAHSGQSVPPGTGDTDFQKIFYELKKSNYKNNFTLQTQREKFGDELQTIVKNKLFFEELYEQTF